MIQKQKYLKDKGMLALLAFISAFPPLSTDLYLPALPQMKEILNTTQSQVNLTLSMFFVFYAIGLLFWGPLSEKYGRKPILLIGMVIYTISSIMCGFSQSVGQLIVGRIIQAIGGSAATAVSTAMVKDLYSGRKREKVMAMVMSMVIIAPIVAPVIGAFLLEYVSWEVVFFVLAGVGATALMAGALLEETIDNRYTDSVWRSWGRLAVVLKNPNFSILLAIFSTISMSIMTFLAASSFIYINGFGLNEREFSYFLTFNAVFAMIGPMLYVKLSRHFKSQAIISAGFPVFILCGISVATVGHVSPWTFALSAALATLIVDGMRVPGINLMLEQQQNDTGSASALINFFGMLLGSLGMHLVSLNPNDLILALGCIQIMIGLTSGILWFVIRNRPFVQYAFQEG
ncbi:MFS transporter [Desulfobacter hydrogenophilus]|uniref:MFS transporter n=1 Tax=Desulfobacter hydrogenophilus TaxID=2291 RepID=A0A328F9A1_9BACT|nr:multidrug effflux MFS transporter [Desulfobacter hydrogenophilus]NDY74162.1 multidrug effflux MFS transporter [Desulfobacter hydrogenophilus]QBH12587.1 Bcr/CflA family efflux MFS transporter [Desulfobacter hydrogenophilus]RAM00230.1 MFS transporter [Desulfobacter hydrogenophilus]